jgi:hypothetical protein
MTFFEWAVLRTRGAGDIFDGPTVPAGHDFRRNFCHESSDRSSYICSNTPNQRIDRDGGEMTATMTKTDLVRIAEEGYGPGAWHGNDLKAAVSDVESDLAFWRPAPGRHSIAEIALHDAYVTRNVRAQLTGKTAEPFVLPGEDWFTLDSEKTLSWSRVLEVLETEKVKLQKVVAGLASDPDKLSLVLGATCHAIYHAGQSQLIKRLR